MEDKRRKCLEREEGIKRSLMETETRKKREKYRREGPKPGEVGSTRTRKAVPNAPAERKGTTKVGRKLVQRGLLDAGRGPTIP